MDSLQKGSLSGNQLRIQSFPHTLSLKIKFKGNGFQISAFLLSSDLKKMKTQGLEPSLSFRRNECADHKAEEQPRTSVLNFSTPDAEM